MNRRRLNPLETGIALVYVLPPIGIVWLMALGWKQWFYQLRHKKKIRITIPTVFFVGLLVSTVGAALIMQQWTILLVLIMITAYFGLYLRIRTTACALSFHTYKWIIIWGGVYIFIFGNIRLLLHQFPFIHSPILGLLTGSLLLGDPDFGRLFGSTYNPNFAAFLLLISLAFQLVELLKALRLSNGKRTFIHVFLTITLTAGIFETASRQAIMVMIFLFLLFIFRYRLTIGVLLIFTAGIFSPLWLPLIPRMEVTEHSFEFRETIWKNALHIWSNHPIFGVTPIGFVQRYSLLSDYQIVHAHNLFLAYLSEYGVIGAFVFILLFIVCLYQFIRMMKYIKRKKYSTVDMFLFALPIIPIMGTLDFPLFSPQVMLLTIVLLAYWEIFLRKTAKIDRYGPKYI